ncbi:proteasome accessory factor C [Mycobacterium tuberculosis]|nr:proteasome accessory factor C [Mycobacterium tuberculosis]
MSALSTRLVRLLNMVPYFQANPRITRAEAAAELGVTAKQLEEDLNQLWMCGLPGYSPGDLIDFEFCGDTIEVTFSAGIDRPLKLTSPEATGLLVALRALADIPGVVDPQAARSAIAKIAAAAGAVAAVAEQAPTESPAAAAVRAAVRNSRALTIDYYAASHDTLTTRIVDPIRVLLIGGHSYLRPGRVRPKGFACSVSTGLSMPPSWASPRFRRNRHGRRHRTRRCSTVTYRCRRRRCGWHRRPRGCWSTTRFGSYDSCRTAPVRWP